MSAILLINVGSASIKVDQVRPNGEPLQRWTLPADTPPDAFLARVTATPWRVVQRLVHGGDLVREPQPWCPELDQRLAPLDPLAPAHNPMVRRWAAACARRWPTVPHLLVPDSGPFADLPPETRTLPLPADLCAQHGLQRYGFHGLAHAGLLAGLAAVMPGCASMRVITLQLGGGCSATAWQHRRAVETSMGFTPLGGLVMGSRPGDLDPGILLHLLRGGESPARLHELLHRESGLKGLSGLSSDVRDLMAAACPQAALAIAQFCLRIRQVIGSQVATLGGLDALVFGGGIGEHQPGLRERICRPLACFGIRLDVTANAQAHAPACLSLPGAPVSLWVMPNGEVDQLLQHGLHGIPRACA